jgi:hypothetical protein
MDVLYILSVARYLILALLLTFYVYSYFSYRMFEDVSPIFFRNVFVSMLSMFQVNYIHIIGTNLRFLE